MTFIITTFFTMALQTSQLLSYPDENFVRLHDGGR
eukprot:CAMPEP_0115058584 /NCGR_PEP_ID=MMETSP0227-20121206/6433_1 /TAXON_ID=89957 /ORGANISM="Polarella glacialis, Strain CCMP 1383" /LENGTH=34 /DNA_ID= /DNA_START= /DNA_END= /DNA_ORIENTATION=